MQPDARKKIMVIDDDLEERVLLRYILEDEGFICIEVQNEESAVDLAQFHHPDLIIMDRLMPRRSGLDISAELKGKTLLSQIPIIMVTAADGVDEKVEAFSGGVDDYITKPYAPPELIARVKALLRSSQEAIDRNPTTLLPGARALEEEIHERLGRGEMFALCHADLDNFKPYADSHGFSMANDVIRWTGILISGAVEKLPGSRGFVSHIGGDDFIIIVSLDSCEEIAREIIRAFDCEIGRYFGADELSLGFYMGKNRAGETIKFPIMTISIGVITNLKKKYESSTEMGSDLSNAKRKAKAITNSNFFLWEPPA
jgi:PleD family two-component response regulator